MQGFQNLLEAPSDQGLASVRLRISSTPEGCEIWEYLVVLPKEIKSHIIQLNLWRTQKQEHLIEELPWRNNSRPELLFFLHSKHFNWSSLFWNSLLNSSWAFYLLPCLLWGVSSKCSKPGSQNQNIWYKLAPEFLAWKVWYIFLIQQLH